MNYMISLKTLMSGPQYLKNMCEDLCKTGNHVIVVSGKNSNYVRNYLEKLGFNLNLNYTQIVSISDLVQEETPQTEIEIDYYNNVWVDDIIWGKCCKQVFESYQIQVFLSLNDDYFQFIPESVIKMYLAA